jgi:hypothetical protein
MLSACPITAQDMLYVKSLYQTACTLNFLRLCPGTSVFAILSPSVPRYPKRITTEILSCASSVY